MGKMKYFKMHGNDKRQIRVVVVSERERRVPGTQDA